MVILDLDPEFWERVQQEATARHWPTADALVQSLLLRFLQARDQAGGGLRRAGMLSKPQRKAIAKAAAARRWDGIPAEERRRLARERALARWNKPGARRRPPTPKRPPKLRSRDCDPPADARVRFVPAWPLIAAGDPPDL